MMTDPIPPQNPDAEVWIVGAILKDNEAIHRVLGFLQAEDFYWESHRKIFQAMMELSNRNEPIDIITLSNSLKARGEIEAVGGSAYLASLAENIPSAANITHHARIVREAAAKRKIIELAREAQDAAYSSSNDSVTIAGNLTSALSHLQDGAGSFVHVGQVAVETVKQIERAQEGKAASIPTGFSEIDQRIGGIYPGELWVIAGRPSMGKTAMGADFAKGAAQRGHGAAFVTVETLSAKIVQRLLSAATGIENRDLRRGRVNDEQFKSLIGEAGQLGKLPLWLLERERNWERIKAKIKALKFKEPRLRLVVLDYVGLISASVPQREPRYLEIGRISGEAKGLAIDVDIGVVLLSQLNREVESRDDKRPKLSDLRESGCLEQDADIVGLLFRPSYYSRDLPPDKQPPKDLAELDIAKHRDGATGMIKLKFNAETVSFSDWKS